MKTKIHTRLFISAVIAASVTGAVYADGYDDARSLMADGDYIAARRILEEELSTSPKAARAALIEQALGECDFEEGNYDSAAGHFQKAKARNVSDANLYLGRLAFMNYDFDEAERLYGLYRKGRKKGSSPSPLLEEFESQLTEAGNFLERVEQLTVIDSIAVDAENFFRQIRIPASSGRLKTPDYLPFDNRRDGVDMVFVNEKEDFMMWAEPDTTGYLRIMESIRLADGKWHEPTAAPDFLGGGKDANYPFMMSDGTTLYYASDGEGGIGGLDIYVAQRDAQTGEYLQPSNLGMPYNSPFDDYLLAIDEENGVGWLATDRNRLDGKVTLYVYELNDTRRNYPYDTEDLVDHARINDWRSTMPEDADYSQLLSEIRNIDVDAVSKKADFHFPIPGGKILTSLSDFRTQAGREAMKRYLAALSDYEATQNDLRSLRMQYHQRPQNALKARIDKLEETRDKKRKNLALLKNEVYKKERVP